MNIKEMQTESREYRDVGEPLIACLWWIASEICERFDKLNTLTEMQIVNSGEFEPSEPLITHKEIEQLSIAKVAASNETEWLISIIERLTGLQITPTDEKESSK